MNANVIYRHVMECRGRVLLKLQSLRQLNALGYRPHAGIDGVPLVLELLHLIKERRERNGEALDELIVFKLRLRIQVLRQGHVDSYVDHVQAGVTEAGICSRSRSKQLFR